MINKLKYFTIFLAGCTMQNNKFCDGVSFIQENEFIQICDIYIDSFDCNSNNLLIQIFSDSQIFTITQLSIRDTIINNCTKLKIGDKNINVVEKFPQFKNNDFNLSCSEMGISFQKKGSSFVRIKPYSGIPIKTVIFVPPKDEEKSE